MDINTVTQGLNAICEETGVCPKNTGLSLENRGISHDAKAIYAAELYQDGSRRVVRVICFDDKCVASCVLEDGKTPAPCCHTETSGGMELTKAWVEHLKSNGYRVKEIPVED
jgi:hypothetical protein